jgi:predicted PhzF superfamily epimerase YddE/YHI9
MNIPIFQVDAFTDQVFKGNPAAVCPLQEWLPGAVMQSVAMENNLSETAFFIPAEKGYQIRWFTPLREVDLCGHATLATAHVLFEHLDHNEHTIRFMSRSGDLMVHRGEKGILKMNFPAFRVRTLPIEGVYGEIFGIKPSGAYRGNYLMLEYSTEEMVRSIVPDFVKLKSMDQVGVIITSSGVKYDFVSRFFAPAVGIDEDPVTGSAHSTLIPFWAEKLNKKSLKAFQCSPRGGILEGEFADDRVIIGGKAVTFLEGTLSI